MIHMQVRAISILLAVITLITPSFAAAEKAADDETASATIIDDLEVSESVSRAASSITLKKDDHTMYMDGFNDGTFRPDAGLTRAQAAQIIYHSLNKTCDVTVSFADVPESEWYYEAVSVLASLGVLEGYEGRFDPDALMTRSEFVAMLSKFDELSMGDWVEFYDVDTSHWAYRYIQSACRKGWISGYSDGYFYPEEPVTRAQAAVSINRLLERTPDKDYIDANPEIRVFKDDVANHWAYYDIMEATISHKEQMSRAGEKWISVESKVFSGSMGFHIIRGCLYYYDGYSGDFIKDRTLGGFTFDAYGRYTTGNEELDAYLHDTALEIFNDNMSREDMLYAAFLHTRDYFTYLRRNYYNTGDTGWETEEALTMFSTGYGNCYNYAAAFYYLSRWLGYDSIVYAGKVGKSAMDHGWVEIYFDGTPYIFDPQMEMARRRDGQSYYNLFKFSYADSPWAYYR